MEVEIEGAGRWTAGELDWPPGGFPKSVWFLRRRQAAVDLLIAPWVFQFPLDRQGLREMFPLANQRLWLGPMMGGLLHFTLVEDRIHGGVGGNQGVRVRGLDVSGIYKLPRNVPLGYLTDQELAEMVEGNA